MLVLDDSPQVFETTQQTPKPDAHVPLEVPDTDWGLLKVGIRWGNVILDAHCTSEIPESLKSINRASVLPSTTL